jgi:hypothetical protein
MLGFQRADETGAPASPERPPLSTVAGALEIDPRRLHRGVWVRRAFTAALFAFVIAALFGVFGIRTNTVEARADGMTARFQYASINRRGVTSLFRLRVDRPAGFESEVTVRVTLDYFDIIAFRGMSPEPTEQTTDATAVEWTFARPEGDTFTLNVDGQIDPSLSPGRHRGQLAVWVGGGQPAVVHFTTFVLP